MNKQQILDGLKDSLEHLTALQDDANTTVRAIVKARAMVQYFLRELDKVEGK
jgi:hypothetical protein